MDLDVLILNTAVTDLRSEAFGFVDALVGPGGLAKCATADMPAYTQQQYRRWIEAGCATAGGPGNTAPLIARAGVSVAVGAHLGRGDFDGLDAQGRFFYDILAANGVDMSETVVHPSLPTGTTFIHDRPGDERGGIAYFPNANNDFDFEHFLGVVRRRRPRIVYYMYSGLSDRGDADGGRALGRFMAECRRLGCVTIADSHTLTGDPQALIRSGRPIPEYTLLMPLLGELDIFFTSCDEARMIENTLDRPHDWDASGTERGIGRFLHFLADRFWAGSDRTRWFGVTVSDGAWYLARRPDGATVGPWKATSRFMAGQIVDLVGAGDSFRAGLIAYIARHLDAFRRGTRDFGRAVQMGNLFASLYIKAPLNDRYGYIRPFEKMLRVVADDRTYADLPALLDALA